MRKRTRWKGMHGGIYAAARRGSEEYRRSNKRLHDAIRFNSRLRVGDGNKERIKETFRICGIAEREENYRYFDVTMANLFEQTRKPIYISFYRNDWKVTQYNKVGEGIIGLIKKLSKGGYIDMKPGYEGYGGQEGRMTRIWATKKLLKCFPEFEGRVHYDPNMEVVILKDKGKYKEYKDTAFTWKVRKILEMANRVNGKADIRWGEYKLSGMLTAIFHRKFTLYGRLHTLGHMHYQGISKEERGGLIINGDPVIELDFSGLLPHLLYASEGIQYRRDPYSIVDGRPQLRPLLKHIFMCLVNTENKLHCSRAVNNWTKTNHKEWAEIKRMGIEQVKPLVYKMRKAHERIEHYFCTGKDTGLRVMNLDAKIALDIVKHFTRKGIPILCIHDSFVVQEKYTDDLKETMQETYKKHTGGFRCGINAVKLSYTITEQW